MRVLVDLLSGMYGDRGGGDRDHGHGGGRVGDGDGDGGGDVCCCGVCRIWR